MRRATRLPSYGLAAILGVLSGGCQSKSFDHGDAPLSSGTSDTFGSFGGVAGGSSGSFGFRGNYPQPAITRCGEVLGDLHPIEGLASAWAITAVPGATANGESIEAGSVLLRISEDAIGDCGDAPQWEFSESSGSGATTTGAAGTTSFPEDVGTGPRGFELLLSPEEFELGVHEVAALTSPRTFVYGQGAVGGSSAGASIELLRVDDECVIGIARGFVSDNDQPFMNGGFVAETCQRQCIPTRDNPC